MPSLGKYLLIMLIAPAFIPLSNAAASNHSAERSDHPRHRKHHDHKPRKKRHRPQAFRHGLPMLARSVSPPPTPNSCVPAPIPDPAAPAIQLSPPNRAANVGNRPDRLIIPVEGVEARQLVDTFDGARSGGRIHDAIDIPAPHDTPVLAAIGGTLIKLFHSDRGGVTVNQLGDDGQTVYYYAHLDHYAEGLKEGQYLEQGQVIGYVGDTGNAAPGNYHLHFAIWRITDIKRYWEGDNINPFPLLREAP